MIRTRILAAALAVGVLTTSCYGPFNATRRLHAWNGDVSHEKWVQEGVFLLLNIVPVYGLWMLGDVLIFNSIEFWTGDNPVDPPMAQLRAVDGDGNQYPVTREWYEGRPALGLTVVGDDGATTQIVVAQDEDGRAFVVDRDGDVLGRALRDADGGLVAAWNDELLPTR